MAGVSFEHGQKGTLLRGYLYATGEATVCHEILHDLNGVGILYFDAADLIEFNDAVVCRPVNIIREV